VEVLGFFALHYHYAACRRAESGGPTVPSRSIRRTVAAERPSSDLTGALGANALAR